MFVRIALSALLASLVGCPASLEQRDEFETRLAERLLDGGVVLPGDSAVPGSPGGRGDSGAGSSSGAGSNAPGNDALGECGDVANDLLRATCVNTGCHQAEGAAGGLDFESPGLTERLTDAPASMTCDGEVWIDSMEPAQSLIYTKLFDDKPCGLRMPLGAPLSEEDSECVLTWIEAGAPDGSGQGAPADAGMDASTGSMDGGGMQEMPEDGAMDPPTGMELSKDGWSASATSSAADEPASNAIDDDTGTNWGSGMPQDGSEVLTIDLGEPQTFRQLILDAGSRANDYPRGYAVYATDDEGMRGMPIAEGMGDSAVTTIDFPAQTARYLIIEQTGSHDDNWWSVFELTLRN